MTKEHAEQQDQVQAEHERSTAGLMEQVEQARANVVELQQQLADTSQLADSAVKQLQDQVLHQEQLETGMQQRSAEHAAEQTRLHEEHGRIATTLTEQVEQAQAKIADLEQQLANTSLLASTTAEQLQAQLTIQAQLEERMQQQSTEDDQLRALVQAEHEQTKVGLTQELAQAHASILQLEQQLAEASQLASSAIEQMQSQVELQAKLEESMLQSSTERELAQDQLRSEHEQTITEMGKQVQLADAKVMLLEQQLAEAHACADAQQQAQSKQQGELAAEHQRAVSELEQQHDQLQAQLTEVQEQAAQSASEAQRECSNLTTVSEVRALAAACALYFDMHIAKRAGVQAAAQRLHDQIADLQTQVAASAQQAEISTRQHVQEVRCGHAHKMPNGASHVISSASNGEALCAGGGDAGQHHCTARGL